MYTLWCRALDRRESSRQYDIITKIFNVLWKWCRHNGQIWWPSSAIIFTPDGLYSMYISLLYICWQWAAVQFRKNIRNYNNAFAFSSLGVKRDLSVYGPQGIYTFRIQGQLCHLIGSLLPLPGKQPAFSQIYIYNSDPMEQAWYRISHHHDLLDVNIVLSIQAMLHQHNPYMESFLTAQERLNQNANISLRLKLLDLPHYDSRPYNRPTVNEIAVIMDGTGEEPTAGRDIVLQARSNRLQRIRETHSSYNPLRYPLFFPFGEQGWHINMFIFSQYLTLFYVWLF